MKKIISCFFKAGSLLTVLLFSCVRNNKNNTIRTDSLSIHQGEVLFQKNCSGCHNFKQDGIGPDLSGITAADSASWLREFIRSPKAMLDAGDPQAKKLLDHFHSLMPSFTSLKEEEIDHLIAFLHSYKGNGKQKEDPLAIRDPIPEKIKSSEMEIPLTLFQHMPSSSDKEPLTRISKMEWIAAEKSWFILDQRGILYQLLNQKPVPWLDISKWKPRFINQPGLATGFGSFAFHPDFVHNGLFYTTHSESPHAGKADFSIPDSIKQTLQWVLCEWKVKDPSAAVFTGTCRELMRIDMVAGIHGVQDICFNPLAKPGHEDFGFLYMGVGDGGSVENGYAFLTQHPEHIWGSILRIDPLGKNSDNKQYGIPLTNPFSSSDNRNIVREIYAFGFRNPSHFSWLQDGHMLSTNIGQAKIESLDLILKGANYGWPLREGKFAMHPDGNMNNVYPLPANDSSLHFVYPVASYDHDEGRAIAGGFVYEGQSIPLLKGKYLFGDIPSGRLFYVNTSDLKAGKTAVIKEWFVSIQGKHQSLSQICGQERVDLRFAQGANGEIYLFTKPDGKIYRLGNK